MYEYRLIVQNIPDILGQTIKGKSIDWQNNVRYNVYKT